MPKLCNGARHFSAAISSRRIAASARASPPPPYSRGQVGTDQPRSPMRRIHSA
jgi:hypothetical protein